MNRSRAWDVLVILLLALGATGCGERTKASLNATGGGAGAGGSAGAAEDVGTGGNSGGAGSAGNAEDAGAGGNAGAAEDAGAGDGAGVGGNAGADTAGGGCAALCAKLAGVQCSADDVSTCTAQCQSAISDQCGPAYDQLATCSLQRPLADFHCEDGNAILNPDICLPQQQTWADCLVFGP